VPRHDPPLFLDPRIHSVGVMVEAATGYARGVWARSVLAVALFCFVGWRVDVAMPPNALPVWQSAGPTIFTVAGLALVGALVLRQQIYGRAVHLRAIVQREGLSAGGAEHPRLAALVAEALMELSRRERSVWTLAAGPAVLSIPCVLFSGDAAAMGVSAAASFVAMALTFPRPDRFIREAGVTLAR